MSNEVPDGWKFRRLGDLAQVVSGGTPSRVEPRFWEGGTIRWATPTDITRTQGSVISESAEKITPLGLAACSATLLPKGSLLMTSRATLGEIRVAGNPITTNQGFKSLVPRREVDNWYLFYQLQFTKARYATFGIGTTFLEVNKSDTENFLVFCPPLPTQRRIAAVLRTVDEVIEATEARIEKQQAVKQGLLHDLFTRGVTPDGQLRQHPSERPDLYRESELGLIPREWEVVPLEESLESAVDGPFGSNLKTEHYREDGVRVVRLQNIGNAGIFDDSDRAYISEKHAATLLRHRILPGDVLVASLGDENHPLGRACLFPEAYPPGIVKADCFRLRFNSGMALNAFVASFLNCPVYRPKIALYGQGVTRDRINLSNLKRIPIPRPALSEQRDCVSQILHAAEGIANSEVRLSKLRHLKAALMQDLLTGRVSADSIDLEALTA